MIRKHILVSALMAMLFVTATTYAKYYMVTDNSSGIVYYTKDVNHKEGAIKFKDARTGDKVTLSSATVNKISKREFKSDLRMSPRTPEYRQEIRVNPPAGETRQDIRINPPAPESE